MLYILSIRLIHSILIVYYDMDELSIFADIIESNGKGAIVIDRKFVGKVARIIDADDRDRLAAFPR